MRMVTCRICRCKNYPKLIDDIQFCIVCGSDIQWEETRYQTNKLLKRYIRKYGKRDLDLSREEISSYLHDPESLVEDFREELRELIQGQ